MTSITCSGSGRCSPKCSQQLRQLVARRQAAIPEEIGDFLERGPAGQLVDVIAAVDEFAFFAEDMAQRRRRGNHAFQTLRFRQGGLVGNGRAAVGPGHVLLPLVKWRWGGSTMVSLCRSSTAARPRGETRVALLT